MKKDMKEKEMNIKKQSDWAESLLVDLIANRHHHLKSIREDLKKRGRFINLDLPNCNFGSDLPECEIFKDIFMGVLNDLPEDVSDRLLDMMDVLYVFGGSPMAGELKTLHLPYNLPAPVGRLRIVYFPYLTILHPVSVTRVTIVHEMAHVYLGHGGEKDKTIRKQNEKAAEKLIVEWGFKKDVKFSGDYWDRLGRKAQLMVGEGKSFYMGGEEYISELKCE